MRAIITDNAGEKIEIATTECTFSLIHQCKLDRYKPPAVCILNEAETTKLRDYANEWLEGLK